MNENETLEEIRDLMKEIRDLEKLHFDEFRHQIAETAVQQERMIRRQAGMFRLAKIVLVLALIVLAVLLWSNFR